MGLADDRLRARQHLVGQTVLGGVALLCCWMDWAPGPLVGSAWIVSVQGLPAFLGPSILSLAIAVAWLEAQQLLPEGLAPLGLAVVGAGLAAAAAAALGTLGPAIALGCALAVSWRWLHRIGRQRARAAGRAALRFTPDAAALSLLAFCAVPLLSPTGVLPDHLLVEILPGRGPSVALLIAAAVAQLWLSSAARRNRNRLRELIACTGFSLMIFVQLCVNDIRPLKGPHSQLETLAFFNLVIALAAFGAAITLAAITPVAAPSEDESPS